MTDMLNIVTSLMSPNNLIRNEAEQLYNTYLNNNLLDSLSQLVNILKDGSIDVNCRVLSAILIRRQIDRLNELHHESIFQQFKDGILMIWLNENNSFLVKKLAHLIAQSALHGTWSNLLPEVIRSIESITDGHLAHQRIIYTLELIEIITEYNGSVVEEGKSLVSNFLSNCLTRNDSKIQISCSKAILACIVNLEDDNNRSLYKPAFPVLIQVLSATLQQSDEINAIAIMEYFVSIAQLYPTFFKGNHLDQLVNAMLSVASAKNLEISTRNTALELMVTITETAPALARKCPQLIQGIIPLAMSMMLEIEIDENQWKLESYSDEEIDGHYHIGEEAIERIATGLGGKTISQLVFQHVQQYAGSFDFRYRRAAVAAIERLAEGSVSTFRKYMKDAIAFIMNLSQDSSLRVQYEAIQAMGRFAAIFPEMLSKLTKKFIPYLVKQLEDVSHCEKIKGHAASALINLCDPHHCQATDIEPYMEPILNAVVKALQTASLDVRSPCLVLIGCLAQAGTNKFVQYYPPLMAGIKSILYETANLSEFAIFRGKAMECIGLIAQSAGMEVFSTDAQEIMSKLIQSIQCDTTGNENLFDYFLPASARISKAMRQQFQPFLPYLLDLILTGAGQTIDITMEDAEDEEIEGEVDVDEDTGEETTIVSLGVGLKKRVKVNSYVVQQKTQASRLLYEFCANLRGYLREFLPAIWDTVSRLLEERHSVDIRSSAAMTAPKIFDAYLHSYQLTATAATAVTGAAGEGQSDLNSTMTVILSKLVSSLDMEVNLECKISLIEAINDIFTLCYDSGSEAFPKYRGDTPHSYNLSYLRLSQLCKPSFPFCMQLTAKVITLLKEQYELRQKRVKEFILNEGVDHAEDDSRLQEILSDIDSYISHLIEFIGKGLQLHGMEYLCAIQEFFVSFLQEYILRGEAHHLQIQTYGIYLLDDVLEYGLGTYYTALLMGEPSNAAYEGLLASFYHLLPSLLGVLERHLFGEDISTRQAAVYGIAQILHNLPSHILTPFVNQIIAQLVKLYSSLQTAAAAATASGNEEEVEDNEGTFENIVYAIGCVISRKDLSSLLPVADYQKLVTFWLSKLPLSLDEYEIKISAAQLLEFIQNEPRAIIVANLSGNSPSCPVCCHLTDCLSDIIKAVASLLVLQNNTQQLEHRDAIYPPVSQGFTVFIKQVSSTVSSDQLQPIFLALDASQQAILQAVLQQ